jgi:histidine triad (HIT) family protein
MQESIFTKIIRGDIPSYKIYEDERTYAFLDIHPITSGHVLVVPKRQVLFVWDLPEEDYLALMGTCKLVAERIRNVMNLPYVGTQIVGVDVPHAHVHIIPFSTVAEFRHVPDMQAEPDHDALAQVANMLAFSVS